MIETVFPGMVFKDEDGEYFEVGGVPDRSKFPFPGKTGVVTHKGADLWDDLDNIFGIPITPEILTKLFGWFPHMSNVWICPHDNGIQGELISNSLEINGGIVIIDYAHELQAFLFGNKLPWRVKI